MARSTILPPELLLLDPVHIPRPARIPEEPSDAAVDKAEARLRQTENTERHTVRPDAKKKELKKKQRGLLTFLDREDLGEEDRYNALMNLQLIERELKTASIVERVAARCSKGPR